MLDLFIKLIDRLIQWGKLREENSRKLFTDFVMPANADFEAIHKGYLATFKEFREEIAKTTENGLSDLKSALLDKITIQNLMTESDRSKIWQMEQLATDKELGAFVTAIIRYMNFDLNWTPEPDKEDTHQSQSIRAVELQNVVVGINADATDSGVEKKRAIDGLDHALRQVQKNYNGVIAEFMKLKLQLLPPK